VFIDFTSDGQQLIIELSTSNRTKFEAHNKNVIPAKPVLSRVEGAGIQPFYQCFLYSCLRRSDNLFISLPIQESIRFDLHWYFTYICFCILGVKRYCAWIEPDILM
jgi:hypothetical protein